MTHQNLNGRLYALVDELVRNGLTLEQARREFEKQFIISALRHHEGNLSRSARSMGIHRNTLRNKVATLGIASEEYGRRSSGKRNRSADS